MSDLSQDWCRVCSQPVTGVMGRMSCDIFYFTPNYEDAEQYGVCSECIDGLVAARTTWKEGVAKADLG